MYMLALPGLALVATGCGGSACSGSERGSAEGDQENEPSTTTDLKANAAEDSAKSPGASPADLPMGLLLAYSQFEIKDGKPTAKPKAARLEMLHRSGGQWSSEVLEDADSNVFHKAMVLSSPQGSPGLLTLGGSKAAVKLWARANGKWSAKTLWTESFGGRFDRMRDAELGDVLGRGTPQIVVGTHDQGVVATLEHSAGTWTVTELDRTPNTFIHEIELGDLDGDGKQEIYATPSEPNRLDAKAQSGQVVRYVPASQRGTAKKTAIRTVVADLGNRHAKEIFVGDVDGDKKDELYVVVEGRTEKSESGARRVVEPVEIRRYEADTDPKQGAVIATIEGDSMMRFLTAGDVDGDKKRELVAASFSQGLWLLRPGSNASGEWGKELIDRESGGFEHASLLTDLDQDGTDELYVASDQHGELRRYTWTSGRSRREVIHKRDIPRAMMTWNIMPVPAALVK